MQRTSPKMICSLGMHPQKTLTIPVLGWKIFKNVIFKEPNCWPAHGAHISQSPNSAVVALLNTIMLKLDVHVTT